MSHGLFVSFADAMRAAQRTVYRNAEKHGWWEDDRSFGDLIALVHSELSEALEDYRAGHDPATMWEEDGKPCGIPSEIADVVIRCMDIAEHYGFDLGAAIEEKHAYNKTRPIKHGGKVM